MFFFYSIIITFDLWSPTEWKHQFLDLLAPTWKRLQPLRFYQHQMEGGTNPLVSSTTIEKILQHLSLSASTRRRIQPHLQAPTCPSTTQPTFVLRKSIHSSIHRHLLWLLLQIFNSSLWVNKAIEDHDSSTYHLIKLLMFWLWYLHICKIFKKQIFLC